MTKSKTVNQSQLAGALGVTLETIREWRRNGLPFTSTGTRVLFDIAEVQRWRKQRAAQRSDKTLESLKIRLLDLQNQRRQLELDSDEGRVLDKAAVLNQMAQALVNMKAKILPLGTKLAPLILGSSEIEIRTLIDKAVSEALSELISPLSLAGASPRR